MEQKTKRRVLSLSLSQPGRQLRKNSKLKRHASATTDNETKLSVPDCSQQSNSIRDDNKDNVSESIFCPDTNMPSRSQTFSQRPNDNITYRASSKKIIQDEHLKSPMEKIFSPHSKDRKAYEKSPLEHELGRSQHKQRDALSTLENQTKLSQLDSSRVSVNIQQNEVLDNEVYLQSEIDIAVAVLQETSFHKHDQEIKDDVPVNSSTHELGANDIDDDFQIKKGGRGSGCSMKKGDDSQLASNLKLIHTDIELSRPINTSVDPDLIQRNDELNENSTISLESDESCTEILQCPVCYKNFDKVSSKTSHLKGCASKHKMSTQQLLKALELQKRQAAERRALGLPGLRPIVKKPAVPKKENHAVPQLDSGLQLAMALSLSLQDQKQAVENAKKGDTAKEVSLDHFGFIGKPVLDGIQPRPLTSASRGKLKGKSKKVPTLLIRTEEERQQIITEKVAMVLLEEMDSGRTSTSQAVSPQSAFLQQCQDKETLLWVKSCVSPTKDDRSSYYVNNLRGFISPSKVEMGSKVMHLSQVVGRVKTPTKVEKPHEIVLVTSASPSDGDISSDSSCANQSTNPSHIEMELRAKLFNDWAEMVNNTSMSDLLIYPQEGREIPTHKIILQVRCPHILRDISKQRNVLTGNEVEVIMWSKTPHAAAIAFLEYVYCGSVKSIRALSEDLSNILWLANHYKILDLLKYLKAVAESTFSCETPSQIALNAVSDVNNLTTSIHDHQGEKEHLKESKKDEAHHDMPSNLGSEVKSACVRKLSRNSFDMFASPVGTPTRSESESIYSEATLPGTSNRSICSSPDMFCDDIVNESDRMDEVEKECDKIIEDEKQCDNVVTLSDGMSSSLEQNTNIKNVVENDDSNITRPPSQCASISSDKTVVLGRISPSPSPAHSNASAVTEVFDMNEGELRRSNLSLTDSKRKLSNASQEDASESCKRLRSVSPNPQHRELPDVEFLDLTQDSDSSTSFPTINGKFSGDSSNKVTISSDSDVLENEDNNHEEIPDEAGYESVHEREPWGAGISPNCSAISSSKEQTKSTSDINKDSRNSTEKDLAPYISPVWDGFEDMNYDDQFLSPFRVNSESPEKKVTNKSAEFVEATANLSVSSKECLSPNLEKEQEDSGTPNKKSAPLKRKIVDSGSSSESEIVSHQTPSLTIRKPSLNRSTRLEALLDESLDINDSILQQAEKGVQGKLTQRETKGTPVNRILSAEPDGVTPLANYSAMKTPELKRELQKFGLKPSLGKRKGKIMLRHIYNELHPWVPTDESLKEASMSVLSQPNIATSNKTEKFTLPCSQPSNSRKLTFSGTTSDSDTVEDDADVLQKEHRRNESDSDDSMSSKNTSLQEVQFLEDGDNTCEPLSQASSQAIGGANLPTAVSEFIMSNEDLHQKVLEYEPIWIEQLQGDLRNNGLKFKMQDLMTFLDEKCITFRSAAQSGPRVKKRKQKGTLSKKKTGKDSIADEQSD